MDGRGVERRCLVGESGATRIPIVFEVHLHFWHGCGHLNLDLGNEGLCRGHKGLGFQACGVREGGSRVVALRLCKLGGGSERGHWHVLHLITKSTIGLKLGVRGALLGYELLLLDLLTLVLIGASLLKGLRCEAGLEGLAVYGKCSHSGGIR